MVDALRCWIDAYQIANHSPEGWTLTPIGDLIFGARTFGQIDRIIVGMIVIGCLYIVVDRLIVQPIENITVARWGMLRR